MAGGSAVNATSLTLTAIGTIAADDWILVDTGNTSLVEATQVIGAPVGNVITVYPAMRNAHANGATVLQKISRQVMAIGDYANIGQLATVNGFGELAVYLADNNVGTAARINADGTLRVANNGSTKTVLTPTSPTAITSISTTTRRLCGLYNASGSAQPATLTLYDEGASPTGAVADQIYSVALGASAAVTLGIPLNNGLAYTLSAAPAANILIIYNN